MRKPRTLYPAGQVLGQFEAPFVADEEAMRKEAAHQIEAQIASTSLEPEPPDSKKKVGFKSGFDVGYGELWRFKLLRMGAMATLPLQEVTA